MTEKPIVLVSLHEDMDLDCMYSNRSLEVLRIHTIHGAASVTRSDLL